MLVQTRTESKSVSDLRPQEDQREIYTRAAELNLMPGPASFNRRYLGNNYLVVVPEYITIQIIRSFALYFLSPILQNILSRATLDIKTGRCFGLVLVLVVPYLIAQVKARGSRHASRFITPQRPCPRPRPCPHHSHSPVPE